MSEPEHLLELTDVAKHFGGLYALSGLTFHVDPGEIVSVIGPNGAGKSTMFNVVTGLYEPDDGAIRFRGGQRRRPRPQPGDQAGHRPHVPDGAPVPE
ncbi:MAG TPA: ATP-binding cassette domain-containing protein, partial [Actinomycetota bacterium]|nr:ATP-binding cassette domain-containing protein [Actinomycetota bacterium]